MKKRTTDRAYYLALFILSLAFMLLTGDATAFVFLALLGGYFFIRNNIESWCLSLLGAFLLYAKNDMIYRTDRSSRNLQRL